MEFDRVVFNEEPGAVYGPGAMPTPWGARERVLARGGGREDTASRMRAPPQPPPVLGASPRGVEHARTRPTGARGATRPRTRTRTPTSPPRTLRSANRLWQPPDLSALVSARGRHPAQAPREVAGESYSELQHDGVGCLQLCLEEGACQRATAAGTGDRPGESAPLFTFFGAHRRLDRCSVSNLYYLLVSMLTLYSVSHRTEIRWFSSRTAERRAPRHHGTAKSAQPWPRLPEVPPRRRACQSAP